VQWLADLAIRRAQPGRTVLSAWAEVLEGADPNDGYTLASFVDRAGPVAQQFVATTAGRWSNLEAALPDYGVMVSRTPTPDDHRAAVLQHLVRVACGPGPIGYWTERDHIKLDTSERCGALAGQPKITKIGGHSILDDASRAFAAVQGACAKGRNVVVTTMQGSKLRVACAEPLATPDVMSLTDVPKLATGSSRMRTGRP